MNEHTTIVLRVLQKQLDRTDKHRARGRNREEIEQLITEIKDKHNGKSHEIRADDTATVARHPGGGAIEKRA